MLAGCAGNAGDRAQRPYSIGDHHRCKAPDARIPVSGAGRVQLVAVPDPGGLAPVFGLLHQFEVVVARNTKDVLDASLLQATQQEVFRSSLSWPCPRRSSR